MASNPDPSRTERRLGGGSTDSAGLQRPDPPRSVGENNLGELSSVNFLTVAEVASVMRVSKMTVYRLLHSGELSGVRVGRSFRVPEHAVHDYLRDAFNDTA